MSLVNVIIIFGSFVGVVLISTILKKVYYKLVLKKRYFLFPKMNTKGIANVAMVIAIATAILLLLTIISSGLFAILFRAYPGWRVTIESALIKIGGLCFGPIIGMFVGLGTDLLSVTLTAGMFHYGYCVAAVLYGLLAGLISSIKNITNSRKLYFHLCMFLLLTLSFVIQFLYFNFMIDFNDTSITTIPGALTIQILGINISFELWVINLFIGIVFLASVVVMWFIIAREDRYEIIFACQNGFRRVNIFYTHAMYRKFFKGGKNIQDGSNKFLQWNYSNIDKRARMMKKSNELKDKISKRSSSNSIQFLAVLTCVIVSENLIGTILIPTFDVQFSALNLGYWLAWRLLTMVPSILLNIAILYPIYKIIVRNMHYNYVENVSEDISVPLYS